MFSFAQDFWPDIELRLVDDGQEGEEEKIRCHRCVLATKFEWFRAWLHHPNTRPLETRTETGIQVYRIQDLPFSPSTVSSMIGHAYGPGISHCTDIDQFLAANVYFGRNEEWLRPILSQLIEAGLSDDSKRTYRIIRALITVEGLNRPNLVRAFIERYMGTLPPELVAKLQPFLSSAPDELWPVVVFKGQSPWIATADLAKWTEREQRHETVKISKLYLEGTVSDDDTHTLQWGGLDYIAFTTVRDDRIVIWLAAHPIGEQIVQDHGDRVGNTRRGAVHHSPRHCVTVCLRLFHGLRDDGPFGGRGIFIERDPDTYGLTGYRLAYLSKLDCWETHANTNFVLPRPLKLESNDRDEPARPWVRYVVKDSKAMGSLAYRFEIFVHKVVPFRHERT